METTTVDGATVAWDDAGSGEPTLLVHAGGFGAWFAPLATRLPGRVVRLLRAGYTGGRPPSRSLAITDHADHAAAVLDALDTGPTTVVGHSSGSVIVLELARRRPDLVHRTVLVEPPLIDVLLDPDDLDRVHERFGPAMGQAFGAVARGDLGAALDSFLAAAGAPGWRTALRSALGPDALARAERDAAYFFTGEIPAIGAWTPGDLGTIRAPTLLVQGGASQIATQRLVARLAGHLPGARVATVDGADHLLPLTHTRELATLVTSGG
jgi:pimeloyl-ACP methyl ester carboxylesterase